MGSFSVQFSTNIDGNIRRYPHDLRGQEHGVSGVDPDAVYELRKGLTRDKSQIRVTAKIAKAVAADIADGGRVSAYEKPLHFAMLAAAKGQDVKVTDATGHWRPLVMSNAAAKAFFDGVKGVEIA